METIEHITDGCKCAGKRCKDCQKLLCRGAFRLVGNWLLSFCRFCENRREKMRYWSKRGRIKDEISVEAIEHIIDTCQCKGRRCKICRKALCQEAFYQMGNHLQSYCKDCHAAYRKEHYLQNRNQELAQNKKYMQEHEEEIRVRKQARTAHSIAKKFQAPGTFTIEEWRNLKVFYNCTCLCCGKQEPEITITIDHVVPMSKGGSNDIMNIQPLCFDCNAHKKRLKTIDYRPTWQDSQKAG